jgi:hypothetical protein
MEIPAKRSLMKTIGIHTGVALFVGAVALLIQIAPALATDKDDNNRPVDITFTKWGVTAPPPPAPQPPFGLFEGFADGGPVGSYVGEVLWRQASLNGHVVGLEAMYEVVDQSGDRSFTALIRGGQNAAGAAQFDGVILAGWRAGARVQVVYQRHLASEAGCEGAPVGKTCFEGIIHVERAPRD